MVSSAKKKWFRFLFGPPIQVFHFSTPRRTFPLKATHPDVFALKLVGVGRVSEGVGDASEGQEQESDEELHGCESGGSREASGE